MTVGVNQTQAGLTATAVERSFQVVLMQPLLLSGLDTRIH